jgi:transcription elongation GreA/GreB family factor
MPPAINKQQIIQLIIAHLQKELSTALAASQQAQASATHSENVADNKYDTLGLEAAYLAHGQSVRTHELQQMINSYQRFLPPDFDQDTPIKLGALVSIESDKGDQQTLFVGPGAGGLTIGKGADAVSVVTATSPLGRGLLDKYLEDDVTLSINQSAHHFTIIAIT